MRQNLNNNDIMQTLYWNKSSPDGSVFFFKH